MSNFVIIDAAILLDLEKSTSDQPVIDADIPPHPNPLPQTNKGGEGVKGT